jgi:hypothetical protein
MKKLVLTIISSVLLSSVLFAQVKTDNGTITKGIDETRNDFVDQFKLIYAPTGKVIKSVDSIFLENGFTKSDDSLNYNLLSSLVNYVNNPTNEKYKSTFISYFNKSMLKIIATAPSNDSKGVVLSSDSFWNVKSTLENSTLKGDYPCKWYQLSCHLEQIFGPEAGQVLLNALVVALIALL